MPLPVTFPTPKPVRPPTIYDYGLVGNLHTAVLVSRFGSVDWACFPRFASPSVFARLLDERNGGHFAVAPQEAYESQQTYLPSSNVLLTRFFLRRDRQLDLIDFMPIPAERPAEGIPMICRIAEARGGSIRVRTEISPAFRYGEESARWRPGGSGLVAQGGEDHLWAGSDSSLELSEGRLVGETEIPAGACWRTEVAWGEARPDVPPVEELLRATIRFWQGWVHPPTTPLHRISGLWHAWIERSELVLKLLSSEKTGAFVAAPTTSLPEWPGGRRNWDYRYAWVRDAAFCAQALLLLGHLEEAERFLAWVVGRLSFRDGSAPLRVMYGTDGETDLAERELSHLAGFAGSRPVRVGNAAEGQFQLDIYGELMDAARLLAVRRPRAISAIWPSLSRLSDEVVRCWKQPDRGIWEVRGPPRQYIHSKLMAWVALDRSVSLADRFDDRSAAVRWDPVRDEIREWIVRDGYDPASRSFLQAAGEDATDAANLRIPLVGFLPFEDARVRGTVRRIRRELASGPFVYRYRASDGLAGKEGSFLPAAFWLVECLARMGQRRLAFAYWRKLLLAASPLGLYPEEYDPERRLPLGNFPQAFTHIGMLRAAVALGATELPTFLEPATLR
jgi:GH15 family glucan-1,4-alpha-glucosidase